MIEQVPYLLGYCPQERILPVMDYLRSVGIDDPAQVIAKRPSLLGLEVEQNLKKMVGYLKSNDYEMDQIVKWLETSL